MADDTAASHSADVGERLRRLQHLGVRRGRAGVTAAPIPKPELSNAGVPADTDPTRSRPRQDQAPSAPRLEDRIAVREVATPFGSCLVAEARLSAGEQRGLPLAAAAAVTGQAVAACARDPGLAGFDLRRAAYLDTETSGLAGGAGTFAFMVGIGMFEDDGDEPSFVVRQVFMRSPAEEPALLDVTAGLLARCTGVVSFNGRAFDAPLLITRYALRRQPSPFVALPHFDLLPAARQRWRLRLPSCALGALERDILVYGRSQEDVPGWLIPSMYSDYARGLAAGALSPATVDDIARVFYHNREDIASMAPLAALLCLPFEDSGNGWLRQPLHPVDCVSLGRCFEALGWHETGEQAYRTALERPLPQEVRTVALSRLGWMLKRLDRRDEAAAVWQDWITSVPGPDPTPYEELAKHHEWQSTDLTAARTWTLWAVHTARQLPAGPVREQTLAALHHRLERLERKLAADGRPVTADRGPDDR